ncbi:MAG TPA: Rrf2 family transcriptional regulator [Syntrophomonadaceae bacterium]|nr:Rrf2 family transcriptional regulator [Syntrophomonadaceae bacterium]
MELTRQTEYAIKILLELAAQPSGEVLSSKIISERQDIPEEYLKKTVQLLAVNGLVITQRGTQGGVRLAKPADKITIADVVTAIEGPFAINPCLLPGYECKNSQTCVVRPVLIRAQNAMLLELGKNTLADLINKK